MNVLVGKGTRVNRVVLFDQEDSPRPMPMDALRVQLYIKTDQNEVRITN